MTSIRSCGRPPIRTRGSVLLAVVLAFTALGKVEHALTIGDWTAGKDVDEFDDAYVSYFVSSHGTRWIFQCERVEACRMLISVDSSYRLGRESSGYVIRFKIDENDSLDFTGAGWHVNREYMFVSVKKQGFLYYQELINEMIVGERMLVRIQSPFTGYSETHEVSLDGFKETVTHMVDLLDSSFVFIFP